MRDQTKATDNSFGEPSHCSKGQPIGVSGDSHKNTISDDSPHTNTNLLSVVVNESIDLILNVLNNAITLHKRVTGSKQCCTPSKRYGITCIEQVYYIPRLGKRK